MERFLTLNLFYCIFAFSTVHCQTTTVNGKLYFKRDTSNLIDVVLFEECECRRERFSIQATCESKAIDDKDSPYEFLCEQQCSCLTTESCVLKNCTSGGCAGRPPMYCMMRDAYLESVCKCYLAGNSGCDNGYVDKFAYDFDKPTKYSCYDSCYRTTPHSDLSLQCKRLVPYENTLAKDGSSLSTGSATKPYPKVTRNPTPMYLQDKSENIEYKSKPKAESQAKYLCDNYLPRKSTDYVKADKEPIALTRIGCVSGSSGIGVNIITVRGYWETFEICNSNYWFMSFYMLASSQYYSSIRKCSANSFLQPVNVKNLTIYNAIRMEQYSFGPAILNLYYRNETAERIKIDKPWTLQDLYQFCTKPLPIMKDVKNLPNGNIEIEIRSIFQINYTVTKTNGETITEVLPQSVYKLHLKHYQLKLDSDMVFKHNPTSPAMVFKVTKGIRGVHCNEHTWRRLKKICADFGARQTYVQAGMPVMKKSAWVYYGIYSGDFKDLAELVATNSAGEYYTWGLHYDIKGLWETYYICNCKVKLQIFSLSDDGYERVDKIKGQLFRKFRNQNLGKYTFVQPFSQYHYIKYAMFVRRNDMHFLGGYGYYTTQYTGNARTVKSGSTFKDLYNSLC